MPNRGLAIDPYHALAASFLLRSHLKRRAMSTTPGELLMVFQRLLSHSSPRFDATGSAMLHSIIGMRAYFDVIEDVSPMLFDLSRRRR